MQKTKTLIDVFQKYWWTENPAISLDEWPQSHWMNWPHSTKSGSLRCDGPLMNSSLQKNLRYWLNLSRDIDNQVILQFDWLTAFWAITEEPDFSLICDLCRITKKIVTHLFLDKKTHQSIKVFARAKKPILEEFLGFSRKTTYWHWHNDLLTRVVSEDKGSLKDYILIQRLHIEISRNKFTIL